MAASSFCLIFPYACHTVLRQEAPAKYTSVANAMRFVIVSHPCSSVPARCSRASPQRQGMNGVRAQVIQTQPSLDTSHRNRSTGRLDHLSLCEGIAQAF